MNGTPPDRRSRGDDASRVARLRRGASRVARLRREGSRLLVLTLCTAAAFFATRALAASSRAATLAEAAEWYDRGTGHAAAGRLDLAIEALNRAVSKNRGEKSYSLALAAALGRAHRAVEAEAILVRLRDTAPEDPDINLQLARLAAARGDAAQAARFYRNALYAPWPDGEGPLRVRRELVDFLLQQGQHEAARGELAAAAANLPADAGAHVQIGELLRVAGDPRQALGEFQRALRLEPRNLRATAGAAAAAFDLGEYASALRYAAAIREPARSAATTAAPAMTPGIDEIREVAALVLARDPLAPRLAGSERRRRLADNAKYTAARVTACGTPEPLLPDPELLQLQAALADAARPRDSDALQAGADAVDRAVALIDMRCEPEAPLDRALTLIAQRHGTDPS